MIMFGSFLPGLLVGWHHQSLLGSREPTLSWNQLHSSYEKGCQGKKHPPAPLRDVGVVTYIQPHLIPHLILREGIGLVALARARSRADANPSCLPQFDGFMKSVAHDAVRF